MKPLYTGAVVSILTAVNICAAVQLQDSLDSASPGDKISVPTSSGIAVEVEVAAVTALPEHIKAWING